MAVKIFINYRRGDDASAAHALLGRLEQAFPPEQLFMDVDNIKPGLDFVRVLNDQVAQCDVLISIIGKNWVDVRDEHGARRLDNPDDFVRIEIETALQQDKRVIPVLVGQAQMPRPDDLPETLRPLARRNAVRLTHERFRSDTQGLIKSLQESLKEIEAQREAEAEGKRRAEAEAARKQREAEAERCRLAAAEASERALEARKRREAEAIEHAQAGQAFKVAKRAGTVLAFDAFLATYGASGFAEEGRTLRAELLSREAAFRDAVATDEPTILRSFIARYLKGVDVDQARRRLRSLERRQGWQPSAGTMISMALALVLTIGAGAYWFAMDRLSSVVRNVPSAASGAPTPPKSMIISRAPDQAAWDLLKETTDANALKRFVAEYPASPLRQQAESRLATLETVSSPTPSPRRDELSWRLLKDTNNDLELQRFVAQYPDSAFRKDAEARMAALKATQAIKSLPDEVAWRFLKETTDQDALQRFIAQYPDSALRKDAEARMAALKAAPMAEPPPAPDDIAWGFLKDTTDPSELKRFIAQYPNSALRKNAEARMAALEVARTTKPPPPPDEVAWGVLKETMDQGALKRFIAQYPDSVLRKDAETRLATLTATAKPVSLDSHALALSLQTELKRVGCFNGTMSGEFDDPTRTAQRAFAKLTSVSLPDILSPVSIDAVRKFNKRVCPLLCPEGQRAEGERCIFVTPQKPRLRKTERSKEVPRKKATLEHPAQEQTAPAAQRGAGRRLGPHYIVTKNGPCFVKRGHPASSCQ